MMLVVAMYLRNAMTYLVLEKPMDFVFDGSAARLLASKTWGIGCDRILCRPHGDSNTSLAAYDSEGQRVKVTAADYETLFGAKPDAEIRLTATFVAKLKAACEENAVQKAS